MAQFCLNGCQLKDDGSTKVMALCGVCRLDMVSGTSQSVTTEWKQHKRLGIDLLDKDTKLDFVEISLLRKV